MDTKHVTALEAVGALVKSMPANRVTTCKMVFALFKPAAPAYKSHVILITVLERRHATAKVRIMALAHCWLVRLATSCKTVSVSSKFALLARRPLAWVKAERACDIAIATAWATALANSTRATKVLN
jgi:hypothetical protein